MRGTLAALTVAALAVTACGDDSDSSDDASESVSTTTQAAEPTDDTAAAGTEAGTDVDMFCDEYQSALASAENPASTEQFEDLTPPVELADIWQDYLDSDWDAGVTVDGFIADNCFDE